MNEQQREYAEKLKEEYQTIINDLYFKINRNGMFAFLGLGMALAIFSIGGELTNNEVIDNLVGVTSGASVVVNSICAVKRIVEREHLKQRVREIDYDLTMDELSTEKPKVYQKTINDKK